MPALGALNDIYRVRTSAQDIIKRALRLLGVLASGEPLQADQLKDGLEALNAMVNSWNTQKLMIPVLARTTFTLTAGTNPHEIAPGSAFLNAPRPTRLEQGQVWLTGGQLGSSEVELEVVDRDRWARNYLSDQSAIPTLVYYEPLVPAANIWFDVKPDAAYTLVLYLEQMLAQIFIDGTTTEISLADGYKEALDYQLAMRLAPEYGRQASPEVVATGIEAKANIKRMNRRPITFDFDPELSTGNVGDVNIFRGDY